MAGWQMVAVYMYKQDAESFCFGTYTQDGVAQVKLLLYKMAEDKARHNRHARVLWNISNQSLKLWNDGVGVRVATIHNFKCAVAIWENLNKPRSSTPSYFYISDHTLSSPLPLALPQATP
jgi:hypothetical protein